MKPALLFLASCIAIASAWTNPVRAEWFAEFDAGVRYDSNLTRAQQSADVRADGAAVFTASGGYFNALSGADGLTLNGSIHSEAYHRFHGLDEFDVGATAAYKHKFGVGYAVPWVSLAATASHDNYSGSIRDSDRLEWRAEMGQRFSEAFDASFGADYARRYAHNEQAVVPGISGKVFDLRGQSVFVRAAYAVNDRIVIGARLSVRRGDVVSTTRQNVEIFEASDAIAPDPTFGNDFFAYRLRGTTQTASLSMSWSLSEHASMNVGYADERTRAYEGLDYRTRVANVSFAYAY